MDDLLRAADLFCKQAEFTHHELMQRALRRVVMLASDELSSPETLSPETTETLQLIIKECKEVLG